MSTIRHIVSRMLLAYDSQLHFQNSSKRLPLSSVKRYYYSSCLYILGGRSNVMFIAELGFVTNASQMH
jgi:hypothetical protein